MLTRRLALLAVFFVLKPSLFSNRVPERRRYFAVVAFLITVVCIAILLAGGIAISVRLHNASIKGQRLSDSQRFYAAPRRYATDLTDAGMTYSQRSIVTLMVVLLTLSVMAIGAVINVLAR